MNTTSVEVTAGMGGFLVVFCLMIVVWLLGRDMTRRLRRMRLAEQRRVEAVLHERAAQASPGGARPGGADGGTGAGSASAGGGGRTGAQEADGPDPIG